jgi:hypothetical protein
MTKTMSFGRALFVLCPLLVMMGCASDEVPIGTEDGKPLQGESPGKLAATCDASQVCAQVQTCIDGLLYPTACGPKNCDVSTQKCPTIEPPLPPACDKTLVCAQAQTCIDGLLYPTACGPKNCDVSRTKCPVSVK